MFEFTNLKHSLLENDANIFLESMHIRIDLTQKY